MRAGHGRPRTSTDANEPSINKHQNTNNTPSIFKTSRRNNNFREKVSIIAPPC